MKEIEKYKHIQHIAKDVLREITPKIHRQSTEETIVSDCIELLQEKGVTETWYHNTPAFVLLGSRSCLSISGRDYTPQNERVGGSNLITIDLSPLMGDIWGDCARSFVFKGDKVVTSNVPTEFSSGMMMEERLHTELVRFVTPDSTYEELYFYMNEMIKREGYDNLDFLGNLGHSINRDPGDRLFIEKGNKSRLGDTKLFTFEPHIREKNGRWGFKHEDIYYWDTRGKLKLL